MRYSNIFYLGLGSIENYGISKINVASDFVAQYTARQKYRSPIVPTLDNSEWNIIGEDGLYTFGLFIFGHDCLIWQNPR